MALGSGIPALLSWLCSEAFDLKERETWLPSSRCLASSRIRGLGTASLRLGMWSNSLMNEGCMAYRAWVEHVLSSEWCLWSKYYRRRRIQRFLSLERERANERLRKNLISVKSSQICCHAQQIPESSSTSIDLCGRAWTKWKHNSIASRINYLACHPHSILTSWFLVMHTIKIPTFLCIIPPVSFAEQTILAAQASPINLSLTFSLI